MNINNKTGFTLVELIVTISILGILAAISVPKFMSSIEESKSETCYANRVLIARSFVLAQTQGIDVSLGDFLKAKDNDTTSYKYYFKQEPKCPSGGTYSASDGKILCSHLSHNEKIVDLGTGRQYSTSIGGNILQSFLDFAKTFDGSGDLLESWFAENEIENKNIGSVVKTLTLANGKELPVTLKVSLFLKEGAPAEEAIVFIGDNTNTDNPKAKFVYDPENDIWYKYKLATNENRKTINNGSITFSLQNLTWTDVKEKINTNQPMPDDYNYSSSLNDIHNTLWAAEGSHDNPDDPLPAMDLDFINMEKWEIREL